MRRLPLALSVVSLLLASCENPAAKYYTQTAPGKYPRRTSGPVKIFDYGAHNIEAVYKAGFSDCIRIGKTAFHGGHFKPETALGQANKVGADCVLATSRHRGTINQTMHLAMPTTRTVNTSGFVGGTSFTGTSTIQGTKYMPVEVTHQIYDQEYLFLKYTDGTMAVWEKTRADFPLTDKTYRHDLFDEGYDLEVHEVKNLRLAFVKAVRKKEAKKFTKPGDLKFIEMMDQKSGFYMRADRSPVPVDMSVNRFGHYEVKDIMNGEVFAFARR